MESLAENSALLYALAFSSTACLVLLLQPVFAQPLVNQFELVPIPFEVLLACSLVKI